MLILLLMKKGRYLTEKLYIGYIIFIVIEGKKCENACRTLTTCTNPVNEDALVRDLRIKDGSD